MFKKNVINKMSFASKTFISRGFNDPIISRNGFQAFTLSSTPPTPISTAPGCPGNCMEALYPNWFKKPGDWLWKILRSQNVLRRHYSPLPTLINNLNLPHGLVQNQNEGLWIRNNLLAQLSCRANKILRFPNLLRHFRVFFSATVAGEVMNELTAIFDSSAVILDSCGLKVRYYTNKREATDQEIKDNLCELNNVFQTTCNKCSDDGVCYDKSGQNFYEVNLL